MNQGTTVVGTSTAQRIRGLEMPWNRVLRSTEQPANAAKALGPWHPQEFLAECVQNIEEAGELLDLLGSDRAVDLQREHQARSQGPGIQLGA